jgi:hypothetical protein
MAKKPKIKIVAQVKYKKRGAPELFAMNSPFAQKVVPDKEKIYKRKPKHTKNPTADE